MNRSEISSPACLIRWVAKIDAAPERPSSACGAAPSLVLPGASLAPIERALRCGRLFEQEPDFGGRHEQRVSVLLEPAAAAGELTTRTEPSHLPIKLRVQRGQLGVPRRLVEASGQHQSAVQFQSFRSLEIDDMISSTE